MKKALEYLILALVLIGTVGLTVYVVMKGLKTTNPTQAPVPTLQTADIGGVKSLEVLPLYDATAVDGTYQTGNGISYLIRTPDFTLLMDLGSNEKGVDPSPLQVNMKTAGISMSDLNALIITSDHAEHVGGDNWWLEKSFSFGREQGSLGSLTVYVPEDMKYPQANPIVVTSPLKLSAGVVSIGAEMFDNKFPASLVRPTSSEQAIAVKVDGYGVVLISGGGFPGLKSMLDRTEKLFGEPVVAVIGGLNYQKSTEVDIAPDMGLLRERKIKLIALSPHDSDASVLSVVASQFPDAVQTIRVGKAIKIGE
jgi:metal-dependent hydrolase (beta-lactamase superfamily II)